MDTYFMTITFGAIIVDKVLTTSGFQCVYTANANTLQQVCEPGTTMQYKFY